MIAERWRKFEQTDNCLWGWRNPQGKTQDHEKSMRNPQVHSGLPGTVNCNGPTSTPTIGLVTDPFVFRVNWRRKHCADYHPTTSWNVYVSSMVLTMGIGLVLSGKLVVSTQIARLRHLSEQPQETLTAQNNGLGHLHFFSVLKSSYASHCIHIAFWSPWNVIVPLHAHRLTNATTSCLDMK